MKYEYENWRIVWGDVWSGVSIRHVPCDMYVYTGETVELGRVHCPRCKAPLKESTMAHLMNAYKFLVSTE